MNELSVKLKILDKSYLKEHPDIVFRDREFIVERESGIDENSTIYRFKIGDGISTYRELQYVSSIYNLFPKFSVYDESYKVGIHFKFEEG